MPAVAGARTMASRYRGTIHVTRTAAADTTTLPGAGFAHGAHGGPRGGRRHPGGRPGQRPGARRPARGQAAAGSQQLARRHPHPVCELHRQPGTARHRRGGSDPEPADQVRRAPAPRRRSGSPGRRLRRGRGRLPALALHRQGPRGGLDSPPGGPRPGRGARAPHPARHAERPPDPPRRQRRHSALHRADHGPLPGRRGARRRPGRAGSGAGGDAFPGP